ncbi:MAG: hypothetical protein C0522_13460, partial [Rhodocyclaceae bacterium]|nr:hypothetical protein [Rhodocyclaceae bacterium]
ENQNQTIQGLEREISLIGQSTAVRRVELEILQAKQQLVQQGISLESAEGQKIVEKAKRIGELNVQLDATRKAYDGIKQAQDFVADGFKAFVEELITGTDGINGALKSLGKGFLSASLDALISGKGPLAGITGLAANDNKQQGGIIGLLSGNNLKPLTDAVAKGAEKGSQAGTVDGVVAGFGTFGSGQGGILGIDGKQLAGGLTAIAGLAGAYGIGQSAGSAAQAIGGGALSGGVAGLAAASSLGMSAAVLGPIGAIAGGALAYFGNQQKKKAEKEERQRVAQENYQNAQADIASFRSQARGEPQDTLATRIRDAETSARKLADVAFLAGKASEATAIWADGQTYIMRGISEFKDGFVGLVESLVNGLGPSGPFSSAKSTVKDLGDELKAFIASTAKAFGDDDPAVSQARNAAAAYALSVLEGAKSLSATATRMQEIQGTAAGLSKVLQDLGWSADSAAAAVSAGLAGAIARLKESFEADLVAKTNDKRGSGYLNDLTQLLSEVATLRADAASLGTDQGLVTNYFSAAAQEIVNGANLTGQAFGDLLARFPGLIGYVREAGFVVDNTARLIEAAARRLSYQDRIFNALNDNSTLAGQLAAFDRSAQRERAEEIRLGGDAINELEGALAAERLKIITDFANSAAEEQKRALEEAQNFFDTFSRNLRQFVDGLRSGSDSPLSPQARLAAAQTQYNAQLALAQGGDRDAINGLTTYASALLEAGEAFYASSAGY